MQAIAVNIALWASRWSAGILTKCKLIVKIRLIGVEIRFFMCTSRQIRFCAEQECDPDIESVTQLSMDENGWPAAAWSCDLAFVGWPLGRIALLSRTRPRSRSWRSLLEAGVGVVSLVIFFFAVGMSGFLYCMLNTATGAKEDVFVIIGNQTCCYLDFYNLCVLCSFLWCFFNCFEKIY